MSVIDSESLKDFSEGMDVDREFLKELKMLQEPIDEVCYRGIPLPKAIIKENTVLQGIHEIGHWSESFQISNRFARPEVDAIVDEDYVIYAQETYGLKGATLVPVILKCRNVFGVKLYELLNKYNVSADIDNLDSYTIYLSEKEVTTFNKEVVVLSVTKMDDFYLCDCIMRDRRS